MYTSILNELTPPGTLGLFSGLTALALVLIILLVEETKERSLESLDVIFGYPKTQFVGWQVRQNLPWFFKRYVLRERPKPERPEIDFFGFSDVAGGTTGAGDGDAETTPSDTTSVRTVSTSNTRQ